jgi:hypothetical protein
MSNNTEHFYSPDQLREAALQYKIIAGKNLAKLLNIPEDTNTENIVKTIDSLVHASVLEVSALIQQAGQVATDANTIKILKNE